MNYNLNKNPVATVLAVPSCRLIPLALALLMSTCSTTQNQSSTTPSAPVGSSSASTQSPSVAAPVTSTAIPAPVNNDAINQQRLIDEINRTGNPLVIPGYRETVPAPVAPQGEDVVELNYEQADLRLVLEELAEALDISIIIDPSIDDRISIRTSENRPLSRDDIWPLIRVLTRDAQITLERVGNVYNARKAASNLPVEIVTPGATDIDSASTVTQVTPLVYVSTDTALEILQPMMEEGRVQKLTNRNVLTITGSSSEISRINELLSLIDADPFTNQGIQLYQLSNANAADVATELAEILILIEGPIPSYQVKGIERINAILVTAPATRGFEEIARWIRVLDADNQEQVEQLFHYRVKSLNAVELAETLSEVFAEEDEDIVPRTTELDSGQTTGMQNTPGATDDGSIPGNANVQGSGQGNQTVATTIVSANLRVVIVADEATNSLLIRSTARDYRQLLTTISQLDTVPLQVMVNAVLGQVVLSNETRFGVDWSRVAADAAVDDISTETTTNFLPSNLDGLMFTKTFIDGAARVEATLEAIAANNDVRLLSRPSLTLANNQEGEIKIGSRVPVQMGESISAGGLATTNIQYEDVGIELRITPQINEDGVVNLIIFQRLSSIDNSFIGVEDNPAFNNQELTTTVVVRDRENVVLGGLIQDDDQLLNTGVPILNRIPVLGNLFSYQQDLQERRELFVILRPEVINLNTPAVLQYTDILQRFELVAELFEDAGL